MRSLGLLTAAAITAALLMAVTANASTDQGSAASTATLQAQIHNLRQGISWHRSMTWHFQDRAGVRRTRTEYAERHTRSVSFLHWINDHWSRLQIQARHLAASVPAIAHYRLWMCEHSHEASDWHNEDTGGNGHFGGLQMSKPWGKGVYYVYDAAALSPYQQMRKAELGYRASGYSRAWLLGQWNHPDCLAYA